MRLVKLLVLFCAASALLTASGFATVLVNVTSTTGWPGRPSYAAAGGNTILQATDTFASADSRYQWYFNSAPLPSATTSTLTLNNLTTAQTGNYLVRASTSDRTTDSAIVTLNVLPVPSGSVVDPTFTSTIPSGSTNAYVVGLYPQADGTLIAAFQRFGSTGLPVTYYRVHADGSSETVDPSTVTFPGPDIVLNDGSKVVALGNGVFSHTNASGGSSETWDLSAWFSPDVRYVIAPNGDFYLAQAGSGIIRVHGGVAPQLDPAFFGPSPESVDSIKSMALMPNGRLMIAGVFSAWDGFATSGLVRLDPSRTPQLTAPVVAASRATVRTDTTTVTLYGFVTGTGPYTYEWLTLPIVPSGSATGALPAVINTPKLTFSSFAANNLGRYQLRVTGPGGTTLGPVVDLTSRSTPRLRNLSSRTLVGGGEDRLILGFNLQGRFSFSLRNLLLRGAGPILGQFGVHNTLPNPTLTLVRNDGTTAATNDDWTSSPDIVAATNSSGAFTFPSGSKDSALYSSTAPGVFTVQLRDSTGASGIGLIEAYDVGNSFDLTQDNYAEFINLSLRGPAGTGDASLIAGFIIDDPDNLGRPLRVLVRAVGPTLAQFSVANPLPNPRLTLYNGSSVAFASNDDWSTAANAAQIATTATQVGAFTLPSGSKDSAILMDLPPGPYTAIVTDASGASGIALIELYRVR
jgi:hypothetical protein